MKIIPFLLVVALFSCGNEAEKPLPKNVKPGDLQFFETYSFTEIAPSWEAACNWINDHDTLAQKENISVTENPRGLNALVRPYTDFMVGYVKEEDMFKVDVLLATPEVKAKFPKDLRFMWSYGVEEIRDYHKMYALYAIRVPSGNKALIDGRHIKSAEASTSQFTGQPIISIAMTDQGTHDWEIMTTKNIGRAIAITIDDHVLSCPIVNGVISGGNTEISGNFTKAKAEELAARIAGRRK